MRPIRLEVQGLTSYREKAEIDFTDLDLFAITGPTGSGKSSLVDAITYALFGEVPRVGDSVKQLISQGEDRIRVNLEFSADGGRYRVHRSTGHKGVPAVQMEHLDPETQEWMPDADKAREVNEHIASILGMDYDGFVRSVLLPQGQFQQFLAGKPEERRKVLDGLLRLDVYQLMGQRANQMADEQGRQAAALQQQIDTQYADATPEALKAAKSELKSLGREAEEQAAAREALDAACRFAEALADARKREREAREAAGEAGKALGEARRVLETGEGTLKELDSRIAEVRRQMAEAAYDSEAHLRLARCLPLLQEMEKAAERETRLGGEIAHANAAVARQTEEARAAKAAHEEASARAEEAQAAFDRAREGNAAALLQSRLKPGDLCPVCGGTVGHIEVHEVAQLDKVRAAAEAAKSDERKADTAAREAQTALTRAQQALEGLQNQLKEAQDDHQRRSAALSELLPEPGLTPADVEARITALETAKERIEALGRDEKSLVEDRDRAASAIAGAQKAVTERQAEVMSLDRDAQTASKQAAEAEHHLRTAAADHGWGEAVAALDAGGDVGAVLRSKLVYTRERESEFNRQIGACERDIARIEDGIERARELRKQIQEAEREARLARDLAHLLRVSAFPNYIREQALRILAQDGSRQLMEISGGRYEFAVEGQEFLVVDGWNAGEKRSVKTLSGGETFLASLALALALAEHLPGFGAGAHVHTLESLFIDEGFSNLDSETLDIVAGALEAIGQGGNRLVGVVTHLPALAERMPARITVHKSQTGSTVTID